MCGIGYQHGPAGFPSRTILSYGLASTLLIIVPPTYLTLSAGDCAQHTYTVGKSMLSVCRVTHARLASHHLGKGGQPGTPIPSHTPETNLETDGQDDI